MIELSAYAKINLHLHSERRRTDGYHDLQTVFCHLDLCDKVQLTLQSHTIELVTDTGLSVSEDLAGRAAVALKATLGDERLGCQIRVLKQIPAGGGLGGGSADAAAVLRGLCSLWNADRSVLHPIAAKLGADVPFLLKGGLALATGIGDQLEPIICDASASPVTLLFPNVAVSTPDAYRWMDEDGLDRDIDGPKHLEYLLKSLQSNSGEFIKHVYNGFERPVRQRILDIDRAFKAAERAGLKPLLCGSGSTIAAFGSADINHPALLEFRPVQTRLIGLSGAYDGKGSSS